MRKFILAVMFFANSVSFAQLGPEVTSWKQNTSGTTGYNGILADVQQVFYSANFVYIKCTGIPSYTIGPWFMNPNIASNQNWTFKIARFPVPDPTPATAANGQIGVFINGVVAFNAGDAMSYNNQNIWHRVAQFFEAVSFDTSGGHPAPGGVYHYHINMKKLYTANPGEHSPLLGFLFDGYPVYGSYGFSNTNGTGGIQRIRSGYRKRNIATRTTLPDGTVLNPSQYGPPVSSSYPLGCFIEDYEYYPQGGSLDEHNGRFAVTPDYPQGIYAYYLTIDSLGIPEYPYITGPTYYGEVIPGNTPPGGHVAITEQVVQYTPTEIQNNHEELNFRLYQNYPNPFNPETNIKFTLNEAGPVTLKVYDIEGGEITSLLNENLIAGEYTIKFNGSSHASGIYFYTLKTSAKSITHKMLLIR